MPEGRLRFAGRYRAEVVPVGLFDSLKNEAQRNFIARSDEAKNDILYAYRSGTLR
jgi:hypothetical protein